MSRWPSGSTSSPADHLPSRLNLAVTQRGVPVQDPDLVLVVVAHRIVHGCAVVPHDDVVLAPAVAVHVLRPRRLRSEKIEQRPALRCGHAGEALGEPGIHVERQSAVAGMGAHHRMLRGVGHAGNRRGVVRSEEHTSELQSLMRISYAVFCLKKKTTPRMTENKI